MSLILAVAVAVAVILPPVPIPPPAPTLKLPQALVSNSYSESDWQRTWPRITVVGHNSDYSLSTAPGDAPLNPGIQK